MLEPGEIWLPDAAESPARFAVVSVFDAVVGTLRDTCGVLDGGGTVYMTGGSLYLGWSGHRYDSSETTDADGVVCRSYESESQTRLLRFKLGQGLELCAATTLAGYLDTQFSLDEHEGYLRLVLTEDRYRREVEEYADGTQRTTQEQRKNDNTLLILDGSLNEVGRVDSLGAQERVYAARFDGDCAYFVTFRRTDPLFCVDLSDPTAPELLSELKLPGFSDYLHLWGEGRLFGLGKDADENGDTGGLKLSMYDSSVPTALRELHSLVLDEDYSTALYNHRAVLVAPARGLIGFPTDGGYQLYCYDDESGFIRQAAIDCGWEWNARGLYIGDCFYVCGAEQITVLSLTEMSLICTVTP